MEVTPKSAALTGSRGTCQVALTHSPSISFKYENDATEINFKTRSKGSY